MLTVTSALVIFSPGYFFFHTDLPVSENSRRWSRMEKALVNASSIRTNTVTGVDVRNMGFVENDQPGCGSENHLGYGWNRLFHATMRQNIEMLKDETNDLTLL
jgi:hypothetical protein